MKLSHCPLQDEASCRLGEEFEDCPLDYADGPLLPLISQKSRRRWGESTSLTGDLIIESL